MRAPLVALLALSCSAAVAAERPRLGVLIVVDQLSASSFEARLPNATGGFARLAREGFRYLDARYEAAPSVTAAGHATVSTGAYPNVHGIVSNDWLDRATGESVYVAEDPAHRVLDREPHPHDGTSPHRLKVGTLADAVKLSSPSSKVVSIAGKDRAAILLAGRAADAAVFLDVKRPFFTTSSYYAQALPGWVKATNDRLAKAIAQGLTWSRPRGGITGPQQARPFTPDIGGYGVTFPHRVVQTAAPHVQADQVALHPFASEALVDLAIAALDAEQLGADDSPDLLAMSFSSFDEMGHVFGPDSLQVALEFVNIDRNLARLFDALDKRVGKGRYVVALTADHGTAPVPEIAKSRGLDAGRVDVKGLTPLLEKEADAALGPGDWIHGYLGGGYYAKPAGRAKVQQLAEPLRLRARAIDGVAELIPGSAVDDPRWAPAGALYARGYDAERSPDFFLLTRSYWSYGVRYAASHGTHHLYDRAVPLVLWGAGVRKGKAGRAESIDVAPTLARLLDIEAPSDAQGRVLTEALNRFTQ